MRRGFLRGLAGGLLALLLVTPAAPSVRLDGTDELFRTATVPAFGDLTITWWAFRVADQGAAEFMLIYHDSVGAYMDSGVDGVGSDRTTVETTVGGTPQTSSSGVWTPNTVWRRFGLVFDNTANTLTLYEDGVLVGQQTGATGSFTANRLEFGSALGTGVFSGRITNAKVYTRVLTLQEVESALGAYCIGNTTNLWAWWKLQSHTDLTDSSGNGRDLSSAGTLTTEADPAIPTGCGTSRIQGGGLLP